MNTKFVVGLPRAKQIGLKMEVKYSKGCDHWLIKLCFHLLCTSSGFFDPLSNKFSSIYPIPSYNTNKLYKIKIELRLDHNTQLEKERKKWSDIMFLL